MRRFVICALTDDHVKDDENGGVHSAHVTTKEKIPLERPKHTWEGNIKMNVNQCVRVWTELTLLKWDWCIWCLPYEM